MSHMIDAWRSPTSNKSSHMSLNFHDSLGTGAVNIPKRNNMGLERLLGDLFEKEIETKDQGLDYKILLQLMKDGRNKIGNCNNMNFLNTALIRLYLNLIKKLLRFKFFIKMSLKLFFRVSSFSEISIWTVDYFGWIGWWKKNLFVFRW